MSRCHNLHNTMGTLHCMFCGGASCKYEDFTRWEDNAIEGLFSNWITPKLLATQRPSTRLIEEFGLIEAFHSAGIVAIVNLEKYGEHKSCGDGIGPSGYSYEPREFMAAGIEYYNFGWPDMTAPRMDLVVNIMQILHSVLSESPDAKIAVHCHAGLGRTGVVIACYLICHEGFRAVDAVAEVRAHRPRSLQTASQVKFCQQFEDYLYSVRPVFELGTRLNLDGVLARQAKWNFGSNGRRLRHTPVVVDAALEALLATDSHSAVAEALIKAFVTPVVFPECDEDEVQEAIARINGGDYDYLHSHGLVSPELIVHIFRMFLESMEGPVVHRDHAKTICERLLDSADTDFDVMMELPSPVCATLACCTTFVRRLKPASIAQLDDVCAAMSRALTQSNEPLFEVAFKLLVYNWEPPHTLYYRVTDIPSWEAEEAAALEALKEAMVDGGETGVAHDYTTDPEGDDPRSETSVGTEGGFLELAAGLNGGTGESGGENAGGAVEDVESEGKGSSSGSGGGSGNRWGRGGSGGMEAPVITMTEATPEKPRGEE